MVVALVVVILTGVSISLAAVYVARAQLVETLSFLSVARVDPMVHHAVNGSWPGSGNAMSGLPYQAREDWRTGVDQIALKGDGAIMAVMRHNGTIVPAIAGRRLSFRPSHRAGQPGVPIVWQCGRHRPPPGLLLLGADLTDIEDDYLPALCRE